MPGVLVGFFVVIIISIAADIRVLNALICLAKSILHRPLNPAPKGKTDD